MNIPKRLCRNKNGAVEGLPLQLIIMVAVAAIVIVIVLGWLAPWQSKVDLERLTVTPSTANNGEEVNITVTAWDTKGNHLEGVVIEISGCNVGPLTAVTDANGTATFTVTPSIASGTTNNIEVLGKFTGTVYTEKTAFVAVS